MESTLITLFGIQFYCSTLSFLGSFFTTLFIWLFSPGVSKPIITNHNFLAVYFDRRHKDLKLLLNLLAETSGLPESFRILTLFDKKFQSLWKPQNLRFEEYETVLPNRTVKSRSIIVRWNDAPIGHFLTNYNAALAFEYTIGNSNLILADLADFTD